MTSRSRRVSTGVPVAVALAVLAALVAGCGGESTAREPPRAPEAQGGAQASEALGEEERGEASYYAQSLAGRPTASGEPYAPGEYTAAHRTLPFGTLIEVRRDDGRKVTVRVNDRGPFHKGRIVDLSRRAAEDLGLVRAGVAVVTLRVVKLAPARPKRRSK